MNLSRRGILLGLGGLLATPAIIRTPGLLMPIKPEAKIITKAEFIATEDQIVTSRLEVSHIRIQGFHLRGNSDTLQGIVPGSLFTVNRSDGYLQHIAFKVIGPGGKHYQCSHAYHPTDFYKLA